MGATPDVASRERAPPGLFTRRPRPQVYACLRAFLANSLRYIRISTTNNNVQQQLKDCSVEQEARKPKCFLPNSTTDVFV